MNLKYAARILFRNPGFTVVAVLLRSLPYSNPAQLVRISARNRNTGANVAMSFTKFTLLREQSQSLDGRLLSAGLARHANRCRDRAAVRVGDME